MNDVFAHVFAVDCHVNGSTDLVEISRHGIQCFGRDHHFAKFFWRVGQEPVRDEELPFVLGHVRPPMDDVVPHRIDLGKLLEWSFKKVLFLRPALCIKNPIDGVMSGIYAHSVEDRAASFVRNVCHVTDERLHISLDAGELVYEFPERHPIRFKWPLKSGREVLRSNFHGGTC